MNDDLPGTLPGLPQVPAEPVVQPGRDPALPQGSILDLANSWQAHPKYPGVYRFTTKEGAIGFCWDDPAYLQLLELNHERPPHLPKSYSAAKIVMFLANVMDLNYPLVLVEEPANQILGDWLFHTGWRLCNIRRVDEPGWILGMAWGHGHEKLRYDWMDKAEERRWVKLGFKSDRR